jgi:hypothetical protein
MLILFLNKSRAFAVEGLRWMAGKQNYLLKPLVLRRLSEIWEGSWAVLPLEAPSSWRDGGFAR